MAPATRRNRRRGPSDVTVALVAIVLVALATALAFKKEIPFRHHYTLAGIFRTGNLIKSGSPVRIAGVNVGKVQSVQRVDGGAQAVKVVMRIDRKGLPIHDDATLKVRPRIFLEGNFFVDVSPGSPSAPVVHDGQTLPITQTSAPVQLDQVLTSLQGDSRRNLQRLLASLSTSLSGVGAEGFNGAFRYQRTALRDSALVNDATLGESEHDLSGYIASAGATAAALDRSPQALQGLVTDFDTTAHAFAVQDDALRDAIGELPRTLAAGLPALAALNRAFPPVRRLIVALRPAVRSSGPAIDATLPFVRQLRALVSPAELRGLTGDLRPTIPALATTNAETVPLYKRVREASSCQNEVILPWTHDTIQDPTFPATGPVYEDSLKVLPGLAGESRQGDANGQWFTVQASAGNFAYLQSNGDMMLTSQPLVGANPPKPYERPPLREDVPCETQQQPDLRTIPGQVEGMHRVEVPADRLPELAKVRLQAVDWLRAKLQESHSDLKVTDVPATLTQVLDSARDKVAASAASTVGAAKDAVPGG